MNTQQILCQCHLIVDFLAHTKKINSKKCIQFINTLQQAIEYYYRTQDQLYLECQLTIVHASIDLNM
jgi:hypothetical protein